MGSQVGKAVAIGVTFRMRFKEQFVKAEVTGFDDEFVQYLISEPRKLGFEPGEISRDDFEKREDVVLTNENAPMPEDLEDQLN